MSDKKGGSDTENSVENPENPSNIEINHKSDRKIKWIQFWTGTIKYMMILPVTALVIAPMMFYLAPIAYTGIVVVLQLTGNAFLVELDIDAFFLPLAGLGGVVFLVGMIPTLGGLWQIVHYRLEKKSSLVQSGFYRHIRHPQSVGLILCVLGLVIVLFGYTGIVGIFGLFWVFYFFLRMEANIEEYLLIQKYDEDYHTYVQNTGFFFPRIPKSRRTQDLWTSNPQKHLFQRLLRNLLGMILTISLIFIGCRLYLHFTSTSPPTSSYTWEEVFNFDLGGRFYPDGYILFEIIAISPLLLFWGTFIMYFIEKKRKSEN